MGDMWMHTSEYQWLHDHIVKLRSRTVRDMIDGLPQEEYAVARGYIQACDDILRAPDTYAKEAARNDESQVA